MNGRVLDAETNRPIDGAVVLVEWTKTIGFGLTYTESYKVVEALSDKDGKFELPGCYSPFVNVPDVTVYKKGHVAWNNKYVFPTHANRTDFTWKSGYVIMLKKFNKEYSYTQHQSFIDIAASLSSANAKKRLFMKAYEDGEEEEVLRERNMK